MEQKGKDEESKEERWKEREGDMAAIDDLYHYRLLSTINYKVPTISARNAEQVPAGRYKPLLIFVRAQIRGGSGVSHCCVFDMAL